MRNVCQKVFPSVLTNSQTPNAHVQASRFLKTSQDYNPADTRFHVE